MLQDKSELIKGIRHQIPKITIGIKILQKSTNRALGIARGRFFAFLRDSAKISKIHKND